MGSSSSSSSSARTGVYFATFFPLTIFSLSLAAEAGLLTALQTEQMLNKIGAIVCGRPPNFASDLELAVYIHHCFSQNIKSVRACKSPAGKNRPHPGAGLGVDPV
jgi:hypothetical protein